MLGRSVADPAPSSSCDDSDAEVLDAEISDSEQPATSKAAVHARITRSNLPAKDSPPPLVGTPPALPESQAELILRVRSLGMVGTTAPEPQYGAAYCGYQLRYFGEQPHEIDGFCRLRAGRGHELKDRPEHHQRQRYPHPSQIQQSRGPHQDARSHDRSDNTCCTEEGSLDERLLEVCGSETDVKGGAEGEPAYRRCLPCGW